MKKEVYSKNQIEVEKDNLCPDKFRGYLIFLAWYAW